MEEEFTEYLVSASEELLLEYGQTADPNDAKLQQDLTMVRLHAQYLSDIRNMQYCLSLKICDLSGNFLTNIDALECCTSLIKLDLHSNQLEELPDPMFWGSMLNLNLLYLHDNGISTLENVHSLSFCPKLIALTLFNTPLCLKIAYRHIVVNSIFSLKALDYYVISDEEIIEDWRLPEKYKPFTLNFFVDFCPLSGKGTTFQEEMKTVRDIISKINYVLAHHSPVLIIQKWIRGYLIRKILCLHSFHDIFRYKCYNKDGTKQMYIQHRPSLHSSKSCTFHTIKPKQDNEEKIHASGIQAIDVKDLKDLHFYLRSLKQPILSTILRLEEKKRIKENKSRKSSRKDLLEWKKTEKKEDTMAAKFRLSIHRTPFYSLTEDLQQYHEKEKYFFDAVQDLRYITHSIPQTMPIHEPGSIEKKVFAKAFGSIRLRPLCSIDKTYWESQRLDGQLKKEREVMRMLIEKSDAHDYIDRLREEKIEKLQKKYEEEKLKIRDILKDSKHEQSKLINKMREKYSRYLDNKERKVLENAFVQRFSTQHTSLTRGLLRLDGWRNCREAVSEKKYRNKGIVEEQKQRKEVYQHFHEERVQMLQKQNKNEKKIRKCVAHEMSKEQFKQSKAKVEAVKKPGVKILCTLPVIGSSGTAVPVVEYDD